MKKYPFSLFVLFIVSFNIAIQSQGFNDSRISLSDFITRMYKSSPFEGVKIFEDYDNQYFISIISLDKSKYTSSSVMNRVAQVKARQQANTFFNGSTIASDLVIKTTEIRDSTSTETTVEMIESIRENSFGFVEGLELLTNFQTDEGKRMVFVFSREMKEKEEK